MLGSLPAKTIDFPIQPVCLLAKNARYPTVVEMIHGCWLASVSMAYIVPPIGMEAYPRSNHVRQR